MWYKGQYFPADWCSDDGCVWIDGIGWVDPYEEEEDER